MRIAFLTNILTPYRLPVYTELAETPGFELRFLVGARTDPSWEGAYAGAFERGAEKLDVEVVKSFDRRRRVRVHNEVASSQWSTLQLPWGAFDALDRFRPDVVLSSELGPRTALAALWAKRAGVPLVIWSYQALTAARAAGRLRRGLRRGLLARADAVVGMGVQARTALLELGVAEGDLFDAPNAHDVDGWERRFAELDPDSERIAMRTHLDVRDRVALVPARLEPSKGIEPLLNAWAELPPRVRDPWTLLFVGSGPELIHVERARAALEPKAVARIAAVRPDVLAGLYAASDLLIFPSLGDPWGLVVNEAMAAGLPVLCSSLAGCADDLVLEGQTGWRFDPTDPTAFLHSLERTLCEGGTSQIGERGRQHVAGFTPERQAEGLRRAILHATRR